MLQDKKMQANKKEKIPKKNEKGCPFETASF
jgi:hypothetical protein